MTGTANLPSPQDHHQKQRSPTVDMAPALPHIVSPTLFLRLLLENRQETTHAFYPPSIGPIQDCQAGMAKTKGYRQQSPSPFQGRSINAIGMNPLQTLPPILPRYAFHDLCIVHLLVGYLHGFMRIAYFRLGMETIGRQSTCDPRDTKSSSSITPAMLICS